MTSFIRLKRLEAFIPHPRTDTSLSTALREIFAFFLPFAPFLSALRDRNTLEALFRFGWNKSLDRLDHILMGSS